jgi:lipoic acid synthetase
MSSVKTEHRERIPRWMHRPVRCGHAQRRVEEVLEVEKINTVCVGARCPNRGECFAAGTATFMIMGGVCTRDCRFCAVPAGEVRPLEMGEPEAVARAALALGLRHVVVTSVTRDDLPDGGANHFARTVAAVRNTLPGSTVEVLVPDFEGDWTAVDTIVKASPDVFNHNVETVRSLYSAVRPRAVYDRSLSVLSRAAEAGLATKSGFMVGLGESESEVEELLRDLRDAGCRMITLGQYLQPAAENLPVERYWEPHEFAEIEKRARRMGFDCVASGPLVRSSYFAQDMFNAMRDHRVAGEENSSREMARR